ncbi:caspase family protein [Crocosphaera sp.]|uniref:caspase family protein n=1 Tax=Crocosphaera sp. TaxID=2729996 RepID=UPI00262DE5CC|nr:caspase family protein [Crocosphaera sp.]MDJ0582025.1 caspase family protein [Crocosphaera sp.]
MLSLKRFYALKTLLIWLSLSVAVTAETSPNPSLSNLDLVIPSDLSANPQLRQLIAQNLPRKALVIGNAAYGEGGLNNPVNDANAVAKALRDLGFDVTPRINLNLRSMDEEIEQFSQELTEGGVGVFYYAGHGVQVKGENYLIPLEAELKREKDVKYDAYPLGKVINAMEAAKTRINILIIDACRDNDFFRRWRSPNRGLTGVRGLEELEANQGWFIAFATDPGNVAEDGEESSHSPFTYHLLRHLKTPDEDIDLMFRRVKKDVLKATDNEQRPWVRNGLLGPFYLNPSIATTSPLIPPESTIESKPTPSSSPSPLPVSSPPTPTPTKLNLPQLLANKRWREANDKTWEKLIREGDKNNNGILESSEVEKLQCETLVKLNNMWIKHSNRKYGFSVQRRVYSETHSAFSLKKSNVNAYTLFAQKVGWYQNNRWLSANDLFNQVSSQSGFFPLWFIYQEKFDQNPFGLPSNYEFIRRDPNAIIVSPGTMLREKLEICSI